MALPFKAAPDVTNLAGLRLSAPCFSCVESDKKTNLMVNVKRSRQSPKQRARDLKLAQREIQEVMAGTRVYSSATDAALKTVGIFLKAEAAKVLKKRRKPKRGSV